MEFDGILPVIDKYIYLCVYTVMILCVGLSSVSYIYRKCRVALYKRCKRNNPLSRKLWLKRNYK